ncbi:MAG: hypothetical protein HYY32_05290 [Chloroflexi bacterium]|nr:hypothetical protein [Chloroflexota bacterium]
MESGYIRAHKASRREIADLLKAVDRDLADSQLRGLSADRRFAVAYSAALLVATLALAASGYRAQQEGHHYWSIRSLALTMKLDARIVDQLNAFRRKRNIADYERVGTVSEEETRKMVALAKELRDTVAVWLKENHPELV